MTFPRQPFTPTCPLEWTVTGLRCHWRGSVFDSHRAENERMWWRNDSAGWLNTRAEWGNILGAGWKVWILCGHDWVCPPPPPPLGRKWGNRVLWAVCVKVKCWSGKYQRRVEIALCKLLLLDSKCATHSIVDAEKCLLPLLNILSFTWTAWTEILLCHLHILGRPSLIFAHIFCFEQLNRADAKNLFNVGSKCFFLSMQK